MVARCYHRRGRRYFLVILPGEDAAFCALYDLATAFGLDKPWLQAYEPTPEAHAQSVAQSLGSLLRSVYRWLYRDRTGFCEETETVGMNPEILTERELLKTSC